MRPFLFLLAGILGSAALAATAGSPASERRFTSGPNRVSLLELYTSEGCSSCPPAERWLGSLREAPGLWRDFVPLALHVNYWDRLGWPDRFATREFTQRQYAHAAKWEGGSVYTPCFVRDGAEWRPGPQAPEAAPEKTGVLIVVLTDPDTVRAEFTPSASRPLGKLELHVALLGSGITSKVTAGENRGETLRHEFVTLAIESHPLPAINGAGPSAEFSLPNSKITNIPRRALAIWVTLSGETRSLQATGGWLDP